MLCAALVLAHLLLAVVAGVPRDSRQVHTEPVEEESTSRSPWNHVPVWWTVRA